MLKSYFRFAVSAVFGLALGVAAPRSDAAITISIDTVSVPAGSVALLAIYATSTSNDVISGFNLPFDMNNDGFVDADHNGFGDLPAGFTLDAAPLRNILYANTGLDRPQPQITNIKVDSIVTGSGVNVQLSSTRTKLFDVAVNVGAGVPVNTVVPFQIIVPADPFGPLFNIASPDNITISSPKQGTPALGSITVVPEPATAIASLLAALVLLPRSRGLKVAR